MRRWLCSALAVMACFSDPPPVEDGEGTATGSGSESADDDATASTSTATASTTLGTSDAEATSNVDTSADTSDTGPAVCGDGVPEGDEPCDDANGDELDGCTSNCELGPRQVTLSMIAAPPAIVPGSATPISDTCFSGALPSVVESLWGKTGGVEPYWAISATGNCDGLQLQWQDGPRLVRVPDDAVLPMYGDFDGVVTPWTVGCEPGAVPIGVSGRYYVGKVINVRALRLHCAHLVPDPNAPPHFVMFEPAASSPWSPADYPNDTEGVSMCPAGAIVVGFRGDISDAASAVYQFGPECAIPTVEFGPA